VRRVSLLDVHDLTVSLGGRALIENVGFSVARGERFGLIGESGSGKTMTALAIAGLLPAGAAASGQVLFDGTPMPRAEAALARFRGKRIGMVFQEPMTALNPLMRAGAQIAEAIALNRAEIHDHRSVIALLREVGLEPRHARRYPHQLSGGQRQRVMIAMALASEPDLLIADEPTSALDLVAQRTILELIAGICDRRGTALLFISHDLRAVAALCTRVMVIRGGRVIEEGLTPHVFGQPRHPYTQRLVAAARPDPRPPGARPTGETLLEVRRLTRRFSQPGPLLLPGAAFVAVSEVSFSLAAGESVGLVGPSGCGKTTLARMVVGLDRASAGDMVFDGTTHRGSDLPQALRRDLSLVFQDPFGSFDPRLTVGDSIAQPLRLLPALSEAERHRRLVDSVEVVGLSRDVLERLPHEFSGGQRQRLAIARALVTRPRLVVLDEPVSALDLSIRGEVLELLARLRVDFGLAYLLISHDLEIVGHVCDRVLVMDKGEIVEAGPPVELFAAPKHELTRALLDARLPPV